MQTGNYWLNLKPNNVYVNVVQHLVHIHLKNIFTKNQDKGFFNNIRKGNCYEYIEDGIFNHRLIFGNFYSIKVNCKYIEEF